MTGWTPSKRKWEVQNMRCQIEKNKEILCDEIEQLSEQKMSEAIAAKLSIYRGAYKALCMMGNREGGEAYATSKSMERFDPTPELDGDTEFERVIMTIPADRAHMVKITHIFNKHLEGLSAVNRRAYNSIIEQLKEVAKA